MSKYQHSRKKTLILPGLQLRLIMAFLCTACISVLVQSTMLVYALTSMARKAPNDMLVILNQVPRITGTILLVSFALMVVLTVSVGVLVTFKVAGPVYRFEQYLKAVIAGEKPPDCRLRKGDQLLELCALINQATAPLRLRDEPSAALPSEGQESEIPAALPQSEPVGCRPRPGGPALRDRSTS